MVVAVIGSKAPLEGSRERGYVWVVASLSKSQVNVNELGLIWILSPVVNMWPLTVSLKLPVVGKYSAFVGVKLPVCVFVPSIVILESYWAYPSVTPLIVTICCLIICIAISLACSKIYLTSVAWLLICCIAFPTVM